MLNLTLATQDAEELLSLVLDTVATADEGELPGLTRALESMLSADAAPAHEVLALARAGAIR